MATTRPAQRAKPQRSTADRNKDGKRGGYQVGYETREAIVSAAADVLVTRGNAGLTLKRVADAAGVSVGNLNYHFRTKENLLEALIERTLSSYSTRFTELLSRDRSVDGNALTDLVRWVMDDSTSREYTLLFRELWAMASQNPAICSAMDKFYDRSIAAAMELLSSRADIPHNDDLRALVSVACLLSEGASVVYGLRTTKREQFEAIKRVAALGVRHAAADLLKHRS